MAANRVVSDNLRRKAIFDTHSWMGIAESNKMEADKWHKAYDTEHTRGQGLGAANVDLQEALIVCNADKSKLKAWATLGKIGVISVGVGVGAVAAVAIINATKQKN